MFKNKENTLIKNNISLICRPKKYSSYIFIHFAISFFVWFITMFTILFAVKQIDSYENYTFKQNLFFSFVRAFGTLIDNTNVVILIGSIFFLLKQIKNFNLNILKTFGITSWQILRPIVLFLILFSFIKTFSLRPLSIKLENYQKIQMQKWKKNSYTNNLKKGTKFVVIDEKNNRNYIIIIGTYDLHNSESLKFSNSVLLEYKDKKLKTVYSAKEALVYLGKILMKDVNITDIDDDSFERMIIKSKQLNTQLTVKELVVKINNANKIKKTILLGLYDHINLIKQKHKSIIKNEAEIQARIYISKELIMLTNSILCCFIVLLLCLSTDRNLSFNRRTLLCFILYFIILRSFHALENIIYISNYSAFCVIVFSILLCLLTYLLILNKDWCNYYYNTIRSKILNKTLIRKLFFFRKNYFI